ncbi:MAG: 4'-phosphopantetheinyl transferase superfamily protein [Deltaproteobacteria bacterium]|nr:4'-phosphopantetheinyl transferase superfamily protein [Deltaproteobacteria bacterium]
MRVRLRLADPGSLSSAELVRARALLGEEERAYLERCRHPRRQREYLVGRALLRLTLAERLGEPAAALAFEEGERGRPGLIGAPEGAPSFNLSHTQGLLVLALAPAQSSVGVDLEYTPRRLELDRLARRHFTEAEHAAMLALPEEVQRERFFELWTLKEAYMKARGLGFALPSRSFGFGIEGGRVVSFRPEAGREDEAGSWSFSLDTPTATHQVAVAAFTGGEGVEFVSEWVRSLD